MKILVIDDEALVRRSLERALSTSGFEVKTAEDGFAGVRIWREWQPEVVMVDVLMPGMTGPQVLAQVGRAEYQQVLVVVMSAFTEAKSEFQGDLGGAVDAFLSKPFEDIRETAARVKELALSSSKIKAKF